MATYRITAPGGGEFEIDAPDDASEDQVLAYAQQQFASRPHYQPEPLKSGGEMAAEGMGIGERALVGIGRGATDIGQDLKQLGMHAGRSLGITGPDLEELVSGKSAAERYDAQVRDEERLYDDGLGDDPVAIGGRIFGNVAPAVATGGLGTVVRGAGAVNVARSALTLGNVVKSGAIAGGAQALFATPVTGEGDYWREKLGQTAAGAGLGALTAGTIKGGTDLARWAVNAPRRVVNAITSPSAEGAVNPSGALEKMRRAVTGSPAAVRRGEQVAAESGIDLTPAQLSGGKASTMAENLARGSIFTRDAMFVGDMQRSRQMLNALRSTAKKLTPNNTSPEQVAVRIQGMAGNMARDLAQRRSSWGRRAYGLIENAAEGRPIVAAKHTLGEVDAVLKEFHGVVTDEASSIISKVGSLAEKISDGRMTATQAMRNLQAFDQAARGTGKLFDDVSPSRNQWLAGRLRNALQRDLDETADEAGTGKLGDMLRRANTGWRTYSEQMDTLEHSALGRILGREFADEAQGVAFNSIAPEKVLQRLEGMTPTELQTVKRYLAGKAPDLWAQYQRTTLERAIATARTSAPSAGGRALPIDAGAVVRNLEGSTGQRAVDMTKRLQVLFGDSPQWPRIRAITEAGRRMADATGRNFSNTAHAAEASSAFDKLVNGGGALLQRGLGTLGPLYGLNRVARVANAPMARRAALPPLNLPPFLAGAPRPAAALSVPMGVDAARQEEAQRARYTP